MALFEIDESSGLPVWVQLRNRFVYLIKTGHYQPGDQLPSVRTLAAEAAINYNTVSKVYINLEHDGYVESVRGRGVFVRETAKLAADDVQSIADTEIEESIRRCLALGMTLDEIMLRMIDVAHRVQQDVEGGASMRRGLYEKSQRERIRLTGRPPSRSPSRNTTRAPTGARRRTARSCSRRSCSWWRLRWSLRRAT